MTPKVLVVEDEVDLIELLRYNLEAENFSVATAEDAEEAMLRIAEATPDLILLDWMLPGTSGIEICRRIRARQDTARIPIIMLTARGEEEERVRGLATGADDYVVKPFSLPELMARIHALLRRSNPQLIAATLKAGDIELDRTTHRVRRSGKEVHLGPTEYRLLEYLMGNPGRVYSREQLLDGVWGTDVYVDERTVDVHVGRLRKAINRGRVKDPIRTVRGAGYAFDEKFVMS
ncbi:phosphate regulon transcriptional regulator PhoB [Pelagibacterium luteolum]|uniref:Phosphate regulon transcriptional regulatory protein PhoB n=1 Tax=Pelagibacterium luteolum TaxID=440168 RepID=A0A1G7XNF0_9HYPH|nr:phosphate regulon transcriptional regulator PhoB [Pelagibacterium luteolum]SDG85734.1 two-component system, OmpR family, phosphate regulon response regulator PhoB [Pelagibacterium luteolum]